MHLLWENVNIQIETSHLCDTCLCTMSEEAQFLVGEGETFSEVTCPFVQTLALPLTLIQHSAPANDHPEVVLLPVALA